MLSVSSVRSSEPVIARRAGRLRRVLTDSGKQSKCAFAVGCARLRIRVTKTKPRHVWTNGFVEHL